MHDINELCARTLSAKAEEYREHLLECFASGANLCGSPIEKAMLALLFSRLTCDGLPQIAGFWEYPVAYGRIVIVPQMVVDRFRLDFGILIGGMAGTKTIGVECDGHDFHERTAWQATRDKFCDRVIQSQGIQVFRFTGKEIVAAADDLIDQVDSVVSGWIWPREARG
jgi:very-short-patch-repair endonuclease